MAGKKFRSEKQKNMQNGHTKGQSIDNKRTVSENSSAETAIPLASYSPEEDGYKTNEEKQEERRKNIGTVRTPESSTNVNGESTTSELAVMDTISLEDDPSPSQKFSTVSMAVPAISTTRHQRAMRLAAKRKRRQGLRDVTSPLLMSSMLLLGVFLVILSGIFGAAYAYYHAHLPQLNGIAQHSLFQTTRIYDRNGVLLYELYDHQINKGRRTYINYQDISPLLIQATIAAEDHSFWDNTGVDYMGITRAAISNLQRRSVVEGGSTVTQQLVKNQFFQGQPRNVQVKLEEAILATGLTRQYPKWKIMEMYLNTVYYGDTNYGVEAAAEDYFNLPPQCTKPGCKPAVSQLTLSQAALLAGLPQSPSVYNPVLYKERALARQRQVLQSMIELGMITTKQSDDAIHEMEHYTFHNYSDTHHMQAPHFVNYVIDQLEKQFGSEVLESGGYNIYTTLDMELQKKVEQIVYDHLYKAQSDSYLGYYGPLYRTNNVNNAAAVVMNPRTGEILAMDGSASDDKALSTPQMQSDYNAATAARQPGSSFKPIVYATAFELGWYPAMIVPDHKTYYPSEPGKPYSPQNYDSSFHGGYPMTVRTALSNSFNIPAITTLEFAGIPNVLNMAGRLGLTEVAHRPLNSLGPSMALGTAEVSPLHLTAAYAVFANQGARMPTSYISKITDNQGNLIYQLDPARQKRTQVMHPETAFLISSILSDGPARYHEFPAGNPLEQTFPAAAKTGTTDSFRDNWTMGYTPHLAVGVWAGNSDNSIMHNVIGITGAGPIWHEVMAYATQRYHFPPDSFTPPANVHKAAVSATSGLQPRPGEPVVTDWFIDGSLPTVISPIIILPPTTCNPDKDHNCKPQKSHDQSDNKHNHDDNVYDQSE